METGNVIRDGYGRLEIVTKIDSTSGDIQTLSFDYTSNTSYISKNTKTRMETCLCDDGNGPDDECTQCHGTGEFEHVYFGVDKCKVLGRTVKEYILERLTKNFEF